MVPEDGLEPSRPQRQRILNPSCLPIPPLRQHMTFRIAPKENGIIRDQLRIATVLLHRLD